MSAERRPSGQLRTRPVSVALVAVFLLLAGLIGPVGLTTAQAEPDVWTHAGTSPTTTYAVIRLIPVGFFPNGVAVDQDDDTVYVANLGSDTVSVVNGRTGLLDATITVGASLPASR